MAKPFAELKRVSQWYKDKRKKEEAMGVRVMTKTAQINASREAQLKQIDEWNKEDGFKSTTDTYMIREGIPIGYYVRYETKRNELRFGGFLSHRDPNGEFMTLMNKRIRNNSGKQGLGFPVQYNRVKRVWYKPPKGTRATRTRRRDDPPPSPPTPQPQPSPPPPATEPTTQRKFNCDVCGLHTNNKYDYNRHRQTKKHAKMVKRGRVVEGDKQWNCDKCNYHTNRKNDYTRHKQTLKHTGKPRKKVKKVKKVKRVKKVHSCVKCNYHTHNKYDYNRHLQTKKHKKTLRIIEV